MKHYSSIEEIQEYFIRPEIDQSKLKRLILGLDGFLDDRESKLYFEEKESFVIGSIVDARLTNKKEDFDKQYHLSTLLEKPSDTLKSIVNYVYDKSRENIDDDEVWRKLPLAYHKSVILEAVAVHNYQPRYNEQTKIDKVVECSAYFEDLKESSGKKVISMEEYAISESVVESLKTLSLIKGALEDYPEGTQENDEFDVYFQKAIYFEYKGVRCKALLDILIVDKLHGEYWIIDVKTMFYRTSEFFNSVMKYRYDIQIAFYREAVCAHFGVTPDKIECLFAVESTSRQGTPLMYNCSDKLINQGVNGKPAVRVGDTVIRQELKGYSQLMELYKYHEKAGFVQDKISEVAQVKGYLTLGINGIVEEI